MAEIMIDLKAAARMCKENGDLCSACPLYEVESACLTASALVDVDDKEMQEFAETVMIWTATHPCKTMLDVFYEHFPKAERLKNGTLRICPHHLDPSWGGLCDDGKSGDCRACWAREVEG